MGEPNWSETYDERLARIVRCLYAHRFDGITSADVADALGYDRRETSAKLRALSSYRLVQRAEWEKPSRWWTTGAADKALELFDKQDTVSGRGLGL